MKKNAEDIAGSVLARIEKAGWEVSVETLRAGKPKGRRIEAADHPGLMLTATRNGKAVATASARDWNNERARIEAACLLAHKLRLRVAA